ncbi:MAG: choice-of-anchor D domain-containing protein [Moraxellaceae bacterium]|nr:choice-of-anchor D domain-containing protein [Pseudobdellovibrionaceae bacterium]
MKKPILAWNNNSYDYGSLSVGLASNQTFILTNSGLLPASGCGGVVLSDAINFSVMSDSCNGSEMLPGALCSVQISSHPMTLGVKSLTIQKHCDDDILVTSSQGQIKVTGVLPQLNLSPLTHDFGNVQSGLSGTWQVFTFSNTGTGAAGGCNSPTITDMSNFSIQLDFCGTNDLAAGSVCSVSVQPNPTSIGLKAATVSRVCTVGGSISTTSNQVLVNATDAVLAWSPPSRDFGSIELGSNSFNANFVLTNNGNIPATGCSAPILSDSVNFSLTDACGTADVAALGGSCSVNIQAHPTTVGSKSATVSRTCTVGGTEVILLNTTGINTIFTSLPALNTTASFRYPLHGVETFINKPMYEMTPFDKNTGATYTFQISSGTLPTGLSFNTTTGAISGTPSVAVTANLQICRVNAGVPSATDCQSIVITTIEEISIAGALVVDPLLCSSSAGTGSNSNPIVISSINDLNTCVRNYPKRAFLMNADLNFSGNQISGLPDFNGIFDGGSHELRNWNHANSIFANLLEGAIVRNLKIKNLITTGSTALSLNMRGAIVHNIEFDTISITGNSIGTGLVTSYLLTPTLKPFYHSYIDNIRATNVTFNSNFGGWAWSGAIIAAILDTPFRISNITFYGANNITINGNVATAVVGSNRSVAWNDGGLYGDISNVWLDRIKIETGTTQSGSGAFVNSLFSFPATGDVISNSYSYATVTGGGNIGVAGFVGAINNTNASNPLFIVDSYFAGALNSAAGVMTGSNYGSGSVMLVHTASRDNLAQAINGASVVSSTHSVLSDSNFKDASHIAFSKWISTIWNLQMGVYPALF